MKAYLRVCRSGGMSKVQSDKIEAAVAEAERLGYFELGAAKAIDAVLPAPFKKATPGQWFVRKREVSGEVVDCFVAAPDCQGLPYDAEILGDDEYRDGIERKLADAESIVKAVNEYRARYGI